MVGRMTVAAIVIAIVIVPVWALSTIVLMIVPFAFFVYMLVALPILLIAPIFALERCSIFAAVKRAFSNGFRQFGTLVVMAITLVILVYVMQGLALLPWGLLVALKRLLIQPSAAVSPILAVLGESLFNIFSVLLCYVTYLSMAVVLLSGAYLYGSAVQQKEDVSLATDIDNFENL